LPIHVPSEYVLDPSDARFVRENDRRVSTIENEEAGKDRDWVEASIESLFYLIPLLGEQNQATSRHGVYTTTKKKRILMITPSMRRPVGVK
jgi:hypothetical protein